MKIEISDFINTKIGASQSLGSFLSTYVLELSLFELISLLSFSYFREESWEIQRI